MEKSPSNSSVDGYHGGLYSLTPWKMNGWNIQPSPMKRKENDLNQTPMIMFQPLIFQGVPWWGKVAFSKNTLFLTSSHVRNTPKTARLTCPWAPRTHCPATMAEAPCTTATKAELHAEFTSKSVGKSTAG